MYPHFVGFKRRIGYFFHLKEYTVTELRLIFYKKAQNFEIEVSPEEVERKIETLDPERRARVNASVSTNLFQYCKKECSKRVVSDQKPFIFFIKNSGWVVKN